MAMVFVSAHLFTSFVLVAFMAELGAEDNTIWLTLAVLNAAQFLFEVLTLKGETQ